MRSMEQMSNGTTDRGKRLYMEGELRSLEDMEWLMPSSSNVPHFRFSGGFLFPRAVVRVGGRLWGVPAPVERNHPNHGQIELP